MAWPLKGVAVEGRAYLRRALTRPGRQRRFAAEIRVLPFHDYKRRLMASPGAMAIPDRRGSAVLIGLRQKQTLFDGAPTGTASNLTSHNAGESFCSPGRRRRVGSERS